MGGVWTLNRSASEFSRDIGFNPAWATAANTEGRGSGSGSSGGGGGRGRGGSSGGGNRGAASSPFATRPESYEDARRAQLLTADARNPPARLTIVDTSSAVTFTNELGQSRTLHPDGRQESVEIQGVPFGVTAKRDPDQLTVDYRIDQNRDVRYVYSFTASPTRMVVEVQFLEHGAGDKARHVYDAGTVVTETVPPAGAARSSSPAAPGLRAPEAFDQRPGAELKGLTSLGILVETLSAQAVACGLNQGAIETSLSKRLSDAGFTVRRNSDEDTYVYVNIMTSRLGDGTCVSRYDAFLYTQGTARLSYHEQPVLVHVSLIHRGGIGTSAAAAHGLAVGRGLEGYLDLFITQIRDANK